MLSEALLTQIDRNVRDVQKDVSESLVKAAEAKVEIDSIKQSIKISRENQKERDDRAGEERTRLSERVSKLEIQPSAPLVGNAESIVIRRQEVQAKNKLYLALAGLALTMTGTGAGALLMSASGQ